MCAPGNDTARVAGARAPRHRVPADKQHEHGNAADFIARGQGRFLLGVDLEQSIARLELDRGTLESRRHGTARFAPRGPEIDNHRNVASRDMTFVGRGIGLDRSSLE